MATKNQPPVNSLRLIRWLCREELQEELEGNLIEYHQSAGSGLRYWYQVVTYLRPSFLKTFTKSSRGPMFIFNPLLSLRNLLKQGSNTWINLAGFTIGLICVFFLYFYINSELNTDQFHTGKNQIYRTIRVSQINGSEYNIGVTSGPYAEALRNDFPDAVESTMRVLKTDALVTYEDKKIIEEHILFADPDFFSFFSFPLAEGRPDQVLKELNSIVISREIAYKFFGDENPIGKTLKMDNEYSFVVTGILDDLPGKSHLRFDMVATLQTFEKEEWMSGWWNNSLFTYVKVESPEVAAHVERQLPGFMTKYFEESFKQFGMRIELKLEPLSDIYFNNDTRYDSVQHGDLKTVNILTVVGIGLLFIACFNYINLSIAQSFKRAREVGIRKVMGGSKGRLVLQFLGESAFIVLFSVGISIVLCMVFLPSMYTFFSLDVNYSWSEPAVLVLIGTLVVVLLLLSGIYPALLLSSFKPVVVLKGKKLSNESSLFLRKGLVVAQFGISICMITLTLLVLKQVDFMTTKELGFNKDAILILKMNSELSEHQEAFIHELTTNNHVLGVSAAMGEPGGFHDGTTLILKETGQNHKFRIGVVDEHYLDVFGIKLIAGRDFSKDFKSEEEKGVILNELALSELGLTPTEAIGKLVTIPSFVEGERRIVGIAENYHFTSLQNPMEPLVLVNGERSRRICIQLKPDELKMATTEVIEIYEKFSPGYPIEFSFLDDRLNTLYENEKLQSKVFSAAALVSIILACMGILGLASYTALQRQKEFGIRKVLGASWTSILSLISTEFIMLISVAFVIATPLAWYFIDGWLNGFAYRISLTSNAYLFLGSGVIAALIAFVTILARTVKVAVSNPVESIKYE